MEDMQVTDAVLNRPDSGYPAAVASPSGTSDASEPAPKRMRETTSEVWLYMARDKDKKSICSFCKKAFSATSGNSTLMCHLTSKHQHQMKQKTESKTTPLQCVLATSATEKINVSFTRKQALDKKLQRWVVTSGQPFSVVDEPDFRKFIEVAVDGYDLPCRKTLKGRVIDEFVGKRNQIAKLLLAAPGRLSCTLDIWTSGAAESFLGITVHWIDEKWDFQHAVLDFIHLPVEHSGRNIKQAVLETLEEFKVAHKMFAFTCDGASNNNTFAKELFPILRLERNRHKNIPAVPEIRLWCLAHFVARVADVVVTKKFSLIERIRKQIIFIKRPKAKQEYRREIKEKNLKLCIDVSTRWNSTLNMLQCAYAGQLHIDCFIAKQKAKIGELVLDANDWSEVKHLIALLEPIEDLTKECSLSSKPSLHLALASISDLKTHLATFASNIDGSKPEWIADTAKDMLAKLFTLLAKAKEEDSLMQSWDDEAAVIAGLLDPCTKDAGYPVDSAAKEQAKRALKKVVESYRVSMLTGTAPVAPPACTVTPHSFTSSRAKRVQEVAEKGVSDLDEVDLYLTPNSLERLCDILHYWKSRQHIFPTLARVARDFLAVCSSSVASESTFSVANRVITKERNRLEAEAVQAVMCLKSWYNLDLLNDISQISD